MRCVWASIDENGKTHGGKAGNQSGKELRVGEYYKFGQKYAIRAKDVDKRLAIARNAYAIAINKNVGYDQYQRETLYIAAEKADWTTNIAILCECDCSELGVVSINCAFRYGLIKADTYSGNIVARCKATNKFDIITITSRYVPQGGDIIVAPGHHVIIAVGSVTVPDPKYVVGKTYTLQANMNVRAGAGTNTKILKVSQVTADARKHTTSAKGSDNAVLKKGTRVTCKEIKEIKKSGYIWMRIPSGWVCAFNGVTRYVN